MSDALDSVGYLSALDLTGTKSGGAANRLLTALRLAQLIPATQAGSQSGKQVTLDMIQSGTADPVKWLSRGGCGEIHQVVH